MGQRNEHPIARKEHSCSFCWEPIAVGEKHFSKSFGPMDHSVNEGFFRVRAHEICWELREEAGGQDEDGIFNFDSPDNFKQGLAETGNVEVFAARDGGIPPGPPRRKEPTPERIEA